MDGWKIEDIETGEIGTRKGSVRRRDKKCPD